MHELGIVFYIIRDVKQAAQANDVEHVSTVVMNIGEVSTIVPEYLTDCWRWAAEAPSTLPKLLPPERSMTAIFGISTVVRRLKKHYL